MTNRGNRPLMVALSHPGALLEPGLLCSLRTVGCEDGVVLASTGRTEVYTVSAGADPAGILALIEASACPRTGMAAQLLTGDAVVAHLFRSAAGLGPNAGRDVYERLRLAYRDAQAAGMAGPDLSHLMHGALRCGFAIRDRLGADSTVINLADDRETAGERLANRMVAGAVARYVDGVAARGVGPLIPAPRQPRRLRVGLQT
ncbi:MAG: Glutamyl-tRNAGlu reductase, N-terminal domain [Actinomycetota bacterium]|nr:Glutamyl-tRNAGlu reductase, N-terminal domain [Actinomycetota bacterium]